MSIPTLVMGAGAGSGAQAGAVLGDNVSGRFSFIPGQAPVPGAILASMTFGQEFGSAPTTFILAPANDAAVDVPLYAPAISKLGASFFCSSKTVSSPLVPGLEYFYYYLCVIGG